MNLLLFSSSTPFAFVISSCPNPRTCSAVHTWLMSLWLNCLDEPHFRDEIIVDSASHGRRLVNRDRALWPVIAVLSPLWESKISDP